MNDLELTRALSALADDHEPADVDVDQLRTTCTLRRRRRYAVAGTAVGVAVLVTGLIVATRSVATNHATPPAAPPAPGHWVRYDVAGLDPTQSADLVRIAAISDTDAWAVGNGQASAKTGQSLAVHWDGRQWRKVDVPGGAGLHGVTAISGDDVWAVGTGQPGAGGFTARWNGHDWTALPSPTPTGTPSYQAISLWSVAAAGANDVWAVGCSAGEQGDPIIQHWNGHAWASSPLPTLSHGTVSCLNGVSALSANDVWAVGIAAVSSRSGPIPLVLHWDGHQWSEVQPAGPFGPATVGGFDNVIALSSTDVWAFGGYVEFAQHWDGRKWTHVPGVSDSDFEATADAPDGRGGLVTSTQPRDEHTLNVFSWDGTTWTNHRGPRVPAGTVSSRLYGFGVAPRSHELWAVGYYTTDGRTEHPLISLTGIR